MLMRPLFMSSPILTIPKKEPKVSKPLPQYDESLSLEWGLIADKCYADAKRTPDGGQAIFAMRAAYDFYTGNLTWDESKFKHERELRQALGLPTPFEPAPRYWRGNMCGVRVPGVLSVAGGARDASLILSWFYDRYHTAQEREQIRAEWKSRGYTHVLLSWPDSRNAGKSIVDFVGTIKELTEDGFFPCVMLSSKDYDGHSAASVKEGLIHVLPALVEVAPAVCVGWELSLWLTPSDVQELIDFVAPYFTPSKTPVYVHFQERYMAFQKDGGSNADFWKANVGKLTGLLAQKMLSQDKAQFRDWINDCLQRFAGGFGMPKGFDFVMLEITAQEQFNGNMSEAQGDAMGQFAIDSPAVGNARVMGSGNGDEGR